MDRKEVIKWLKIMKANLDSFPEVSNAKKIEALAEAIRLLKNEQSKEPTGSTTKNDLGVDAVSRKAVINQIFYSTDNNGDVVLGSALRERIARLPSVTPQEPRWILVSERLPENKETVLVTFKHFVSGNTIGLGSVILLRGKPHWHVREQNLGTYDVLAWMPLPKPYESQESEEV